MERFIKEEIDGPISILPPLSELPIAAYKVFSAHINTSKLLIKNYESFKENEKEILTDSLKKFTNKLEGSFLSYLNETILNYNAFPPSINNRRFIKFLKEFTSRED